MALFRHVLGIGSVLLAGALTGTAQDLSTFSAIDGKTRSGRLIRMVNDTLVILTTQPDGSVVERRAHKSRFMAVTLPDQKPLDLTKSNWAPAADNWDDIAPVYSPVAPDSTTPQKTAATPVVASIADTARTVERLFSALLGRVVVPAGEKSAIALLPFSVNGPVPPQAGAAIAEFGIAAFSGDARFAVVERTEFKKVAAELALSQSGMIDDSKAIEAGKQLAARYLVIGAISQERGMRMVSARVIAVETGVVTAAATGAIAVREMDNLTKELFAERATAGSSLMRSVVLPGWGQFYTGHSWRGGVEASAAIAGAGLLVYSYIALANAKQDAEPYLNRTEASFVRGVDTPESWLERANGAIRKENRLIDQCSIVGISLGAFWAVNLIDAWYCGAKESAKVRRLYFSATPPLGAAPGGLAMRVTF